MLFQKKYRSPLQVKASIHGGNNFSYLLYYNCLEFFEDGNVLLTRETDSSTDAYDQDDLRFFQNHKLNGHYRTDAKNFIHCIFETQFWEFTGRFTGTDKQMLVFHSHDSRLHQSWSEVFSLIE